MFLIGKMCARSLHPVLPEKEKFAEAPPGSTQWKLYNSNPQFYDPSRGTLSEIGAPQ